MYIVVVGEPFNESMKCFGPFANSEDADHWADEVLPEYGKPSHWLVELKDPNSVP